MREIYTKYYNIDQIQWLALIASSETATWFQTPEAYDFFSDQPELFLPFVVAISGERELRAVCVGYITQDKNALKQFVTRRAIIIGGPVLANDCTDDEVYALMNGVRDVVGRKAIYIETRNFNDYSRWREGFTRAGFRYERHNNFHIDTSGFSLHHGEDEIDYDNVVTGTMGKNRVRDIKTSFRDGAIVIDHPTIEQVREYYAILKNLYTTKVKTPLFPLSFFEKLYEHKDGRFIIVALPHKDNPDKQEIIGGTVCVELEGKCMYEWFVAGRDGEWKSIFPSSVATYAGIRYAAEHDMPRFDMMGAGKPGEAYGVRDFKARFGGELVEHGRFKCICEPFLYMMGEVGVKILKSR